ncbi:MAG TPA: DUF4388 domain-containing protein, partial [Geobacteraceae bacterium]|nr:DUF4388 domain-containing protein [Geobacteraceae bacterium]
NNSVRIGDILVRRNSIAPDALEQTLREQQEAGADRKPLIVALLDKGLVREEDAYRGLEELIEITVVEILNWKKGTFVLDMLSGQIIDGYRYYPAKIDREINVDTQGVLMDSLRIFDEKRRDGELPEDSTADDEAPGGSGTEDSGPVLSADDLGLADLDQLERRIPDIFTGLADRDPALVHRQKLGDSAASLPPGKRDELAAFLAKFPAGTEAREAAQTRSLIFFSSDETLQHAVATVCKHAGIPVFATNDEQNLDPIILSSLAHNRLPLLVFDSPDPAYGSFSPENIAALRRHHRERYPQMRIIQLAPPHADAFTLQAYDDGARAVLPRPARETAAETFVADTVRFLLTFQSYVRQCTAEQDSSLAGRLRESIARLRKAREVPEVALALLQFTALTFQRAITLIVRETELVAERGIGIKGSMGRSATPPLGFRISLAGPSLFRRVIDTGRIHFGTGNDATVRERLFTEIGAPHRSSLLLLPLRVRGRTIALIYGDFGSGDIAPVELDLLDILASQAELTLDNAAYRKKLEKSPVKG